MAYRLADFKDRLKEIAPIPLARKCCRGSREGNDPLSTLNSFNSSGRWHIKGKFGAIYAGESRKICRQEILRQFSGVTPKYGYRLYTINIKLSKVLDLTSPDNLKTLNIEEDELVSGEGINPGSVTIPNSIADSAHDLGYEAILAPSATGTGKIIVIYPDNFRNGSEMKVESETGLF